ncbi:dihydroneopterin triphosphate diphosphatase [Acidithiobacillus thiooxidans]|uniref:Dihydroneopterin triphosphate diphosphatase n=1 Tax=Acidithiobacillus thiooxidans ATCC 19377 TaxID=637390 RepID=A0A543Q6X7_ACITH|nr:dihydroneopterin triphosphate diphosphatase [Acidithiobacillus thiooxidans]MDX5933713.1 dihydroneopterin triphosphate diphosphatase [Acidithiobacillus thiooxidans]TQN52071.1 Dihydroneopterin triphosphate diphosphatase [Acidithiobacillus thiooxidans ATCC 19377]
MFKIPESILVMIYAGQQVLLLERAQPEGFWQSVTGSLEPGESWRDAAVRELREETGFAAEGLADTGVRNRFPIVPPWRERYAPEVEFNEERIFTLALPEPQVPQLRRQEHVNFAWLPAVEAARRTGSWTNRDAIYRHFGVRLDAQQAAS